MVVVSLGLAWGAGWTVHGTVAAQSEQAEQKPPQNGPASMPKNPNGDAAEKKSPAPNAEAKSRDVANLPVRTLPGHTDRLTSVAYSPDGKFIATAAWDGTARIWDVSTGQEVRRLDFPAT